MCHCKNLTEIVGYRDISRVPRDIDTIRERNDNMNIGQCKKCGQNVILEDIYPEYEDIVNNEPRDSIAYIEACSDMATMQCSCKQGEEERYKRKNREEAVESINDIFSKNEDIRDILSSCIAPLQERSMDSITIKSNNMKAVLSMNTKGYIKIKREITDTVSDEI